MREWTGHQSLDHVSNYDILRRFSVLMTAPRLPGKVVRGWRVYNGLEPWITFGIIP